MNTSNNSAHTPGPWFVWNMVHEKHGRAMTAEEIGEYVKNNVLQSIKDGGSPDRFLFVTQAGSGVPDICHVGNGPAGPANARLIAAAPQLVEALAAFVTEMRAVNALDPTDQPRRMGLLVPKALAALTAAGVEP